MLALFAAALLLRVLYVLGYGFDGLYGQDAFAYYDFAAAVASGRTPGPFFWPLGYPVLLTGAFALFGVSAAAAQAINLALGALLAPLVYVLARQAGCRWPGALAAGLLMAICGQAVQSSLVVMADIPALAWAVISAVALNVYLDDRRRRWLALAAVTVALAAVTRWLYLALVLPWGMAVLVAWRGRFRWQDALAALAAALVILLPQMLYSTTGPYPTLNHAWVRGWSPENMLRRDFVNVDGVFHYEQANALFYARPFYDAYYLAPVFAVFMLPGLWTLWRRDVARALMTAGWALVPYGFLVGIPYQNIRFPLIVFPAIAVLAGLGIEAVEGWQVIRGRQAAVWGILGMVVLFGLGQTVSAGQEVIGTFLGRQQADRAAAAWVTAYVPPEANLYTFGLTLTLQHYTDLEVYELFYETPDTLTDRWVAGQPDYLLINVWQIENQWDGRAPQIAFHWLRDVRGLTELGRYGNYTLFRVGG